MKEKLLKYIKLKFKNKTFDVLYALLLAFAVRLFLVNFGTLQLDHGTFISWGTSLASEGLRTFYSGWSDYLPGYLYILWFLGKVNLLLPSFQTLLFKLPAILADIATSYLIYKIVLKYKSRKTAIIAAITYAFNPAIIANSTLWGQVDSLTALFSLFAIYIFPTNFLLPQKGKLFLSAISLAVGTLIKPQAAFILPAILYLFIVNKRKLIELLEYGIVGLSVFVLGFLPFSNQSNLFKFVFERLSVSSSQYPYGSINAFTFWGLFGFWKPDTQIFWVGLLISVVVISISILIILKKRPKAGEYLLSTISLLVTFLFLTRIHERHLLPVFAPLIVSSIINPILFVPYVALSLTYISNLYYAFVWITEDFKEVFNLYFIKFFILLNVGMFLTVLTSIFKKVNFNFEIFFSNLINRSNNSKDIVFRLKDISDKKRNIYLSIIILFSIFTYIYSIGSIKEMYFDEIYHAYTAKLVLHNDPKAWEFWNPNPEGFAYEWTHPPISKLGMVFGMKIFGETPFGYRIPQAILGMAAIYLIYLLSKEIFRDKLVGILSAAVFSIAGLPLVLSRMGMNDSYVLFFSLLSIYLYIKDKNVLSAISFGLSIASKWSGIYAIPILAISHFVFKKKFRLSYFSFLVLPIAVYVASYSVMFATGHTWANFIDTQKQMWWYHTGLVATHPYTSPAWSWPLLLRPIYLYNGPELNGYVERIYAFGNPLVFWFGLGSVFMSFYISFKEKSKKLGFVVFSYLIFFLPWIASPRIMFLYHYLPSIPFLAISTGFILRRYPKLIAYYLLIATALFIYFYPHYTGLRIPEWLDSSYYWFASWR